MEDAPMKTAVVKSRLVLRQHWCISAFAKGIIFQVPHFKEPLHFFLLQIRKFLFLMPAKLFNQETLAPANRNGVKTIDAKVLRDPGPVHIKRTQDP